MKIAINGIGIAGPTLAYWLRRFGHEPVLFEKAPALRTGGYIIDFWGLGFELAERMGIISRLIEQAYLMKRLRLVDEQGVTVAGMEISPIRKQARGRFFSVSRADLAAALFRACEGVPTHFGVSLVGLQQHDRGVLTTLSNGEHAEFDLVVGADGLHSRVRSLAFGPETHFEKPLGCHVAAFRVPGYPHRDELTYVSHTVPRRHVARVALRDGETLILFIWRSELVDGNSDGVEGRSVVNQAFGEMGWEVPEMLEHMSAAKDFYFDRVSQVHLDHWSVGRVALLGDAAACASLLAGEGTGLAMIEAYVLAGEIHRAGNDVEAGLRAYETRLQSFVRAKQKAALRFRGFFAPETTLGVWARDVAVKTFSVPFVAQHVVARSLHDDLCLPEYDAA